MFTVLARLSLPLCLRRFFLDVEELEDEEEEDDDDLSSFSALSSFGLYAILIYYDISGVGAANGLFSMMFSLKMCYLSLIYMFKPGVSIGLCLTSMDGYEGFISDDLSLLISVTSVFFLTSIPCANAFFTSVRLFSYLEDIDCFFVGTCDICVLFKFKYYLLLSK